MKKGLVAIFCVISSLSCYAATHYQCPSSIVCRMNGSNNCIYDTNEYPGMSTITVPMGIDLVCTHNGNLLIGIPQLKGKELTLTSKNFPFSGAMSTSEPPTITCVYSSLDFTATYISEQIQCAIKNGTTITLSGALVPAWLPTSNENKAATTPNDAAASLPTPNMCSNEDPAKCPFKQR